MHDFCHLLDRARGGPYDPMSNLMLMPYPSIYKEENIHFQQQNPAVTRALVRGSLDSTGRDT
jgi:hypothetical protein